MLTRRRLLQVAAASPIAGLSAPAEAAAPPLVGPARASPYLGRTPRLLTGLPEIDAATAGISIGGLTAIVGHGCSGKTELALAIARSVREQHGSNVLMMCAREPAHQLARHSRRWPLHQGTTIIAPRNWTMWECNSALRGFGEAVYLAPYVVWADIDRLLDVLDGPHYAHERDCALIILDGFGAPNTHLTAEPRPPTCLTEEQVSTLHFVAATRQIAVLLTVRTPDFDYNDPARFIATATKHPLRDVLDRYCDRTLWLLRPGLWDKNFPEDAVEILTRWETGQEHWQTPFIVR